MTRPDTIEAPAYVATMTEAQFQATVIDAAQTLGWLCVAKRQLPIEPLPTGTVVCRATIPGNPLPKERPRAGFRRVRTPPRTVAAEIAFGTLVKQGLAINEPDDAHDLGIDLEFYREAGNRVDIDNLVKLALDSCNGVVWRDDAQITELTARLVRKAADPRTELTVRVVGNRAVGTCVRCGAPIRVRIGQDDPADIWAKRKVILTYCSANCYHRRLEPFDPAERDEVEGYPDLTLFRGDQYRLIELKTERGVVSPRQREWILRLDEKGCDVYVVRPSDWDDLMELLQ